MRSNFDIALKFLLDHENVYERGHYGDYAHVICENVSGDAGGLTKFGIDQASHPDVNIRRLDYAGARLIYLNNEWRKCRCDDLPDKIDIAVFDIAVNNGMGIAILLLQRALNDVSSKMPALIADGHIGPKTIVRANETPKAVARLLQLRAQHYHAIVEHKPSQNKFLQGWMNRNADLSQLLLA